MSNRSGGPPPVGYTLVGDVRFYNTPGPPGEIRGPEPEPAPVAPELLPGDMPAARAGLARGPGGAVTDLALRDATRRLKKTRRAAVPLRPPPAALAGNADEKIAALLAYIRELHLHVEAHALHLSELTRESTELSSDLREFTGTLTAKDRAIEDTLKSFKSEFAAFREQALFLANLSQAFAIMAKEYRATYKEIAEIVKERVGYEKVLYGGRKILVTAFMAALSGVSAGLAAGLTATILDGLVEKFAESYQKSFGDYEKVSAAATKAAEKSVEHPTEKLIDPLLDWMGEKIVEGTVGRGKGERLHAIDPLDYFFDSHLKLQRLASEMHGGKLADLKAAVTKAMGGLPAELHFLKAAHAADSAEWKRFAADVEIYMRRLIWRLHCRSQWENTISSYLVEAKYNVFLFAVRSTLPAFTGFDPIHLMHVEGTAERWPREVWGSIRAWPPHFMEHIVPAFQGDEPEHQSKHALFAHSPWLSMAVVNCCQVRRPDGKTIDLQRNIHLGTMGVPLPASSEGAKTNQHGEKIVSDYELVFGTGDVAMDVVRQVESTGGTYVRISEIRQGRGSASGLNQRDAYVAEGKHGKKLSAHEELQMTVGRWLTVLFQAVPWRAAGIADTHVQIVEATDDWKPKAGAGGAEVVEHDKNTKNFATSGSQHVSFQMNKAGKFLVRVVPTADLNKSESSGLVAETRMVHRTMFDKAFWKVLVAPA